METCMKCAAPLSFNEIGAHKKFLGRGAQTFLCKACLAKKLKVSPAVIDQKIEQFKRQGCALFV